MTTTEYLNTRRAVTLTEDDWTSLTCFLLMTTNYRRKERDAWASCAEEKNEDGTPRFPNAESNARYFDDLDRKIERIVAAIDDRRR